MIGELDGLAFIEARGWPYRRHGDELETTCPFCKKPRHLYLNAVSGLWKCQRCAAGGNLHQLRERLGLSNTHGVQSFRQALGTQPKRMPRSQVDAMHQALLADVEALSYCTQVRRWSLDVIKRMKIGLRLDQRGKWLAFPWWRRGEPAGMKYRILPAFEQAVPDRFEREAGYESILFNVDALDRDDEVILASGESDALALLTMGFENVVAMTTGESSLPASAVDALAQKRRVLTAFDNDAAGQKGARSVAKRIGLHRAWIVSFPPDVKDVNEFLIKGGDRGAFQALLDHAVQLDVPSVLSLSQALDRLEEEKTLGVWDEFDTTTPWSTLNQRLGRWRPGNLITLSGPQGTGKTTFALNIVAHWAEKGYPALAYCLEMTVEELVQHVLCAHYRIEESAVTGEVISRARQEMAEWPLYLGADPAVTGRKEVLDVLAQAVRRYGLRLLAFDNLHMLARSIEHRTEEVGVLTKSFKFFAMEHQIPFVMIAQPRKLAPGQVMTPWDLKDSSDIFSDSDQIILLHREMIGAQRENEAVAAAQRDAADNYSPLTLVRLAKGRHQASKDVLLFCEGAQHRFRDIAPSDIPKARPTTPAAHQRHPGHADG